MNGRFFGGRQIKAYQWDGKERFEEREEITLDILEDEDEKERLENYAKWLEDDVVVDQGDQ